MKRLIIYMVLAALSIYLAGCSSFGIDSMIQSSSGSKSAAPVKEAGSGEEVKTISGLSNNIEKQLDAGTYKGFTVNYNSVVITGRGPGKTVIAGDVVIKKNNCIIQNLTIRGNVVIEGNNADLTKARIQGDVDSRGKNSKW